MAYRPRTLALFICCLPVLLTFASDESAAGNIGPVIRTVAGTNSANATSGLAGAHAGYNWQQGGVVFGFETDLQALHLASSMNGGLIYTPPPPGPTDFARTQATIDWYGTFRGRVGTNFGPLLVYLTGGVAYGNVGLNSSFSAFGLTTQLQNTQTKAGGVAGFGFEYILQPNVMLTFGYQYVDLGRISGFSSTTAPLGPFAFATLSQSANVHAQFQTAMVGISWRFAPSGTGSPFAGGYAGAHGGGAWGNSANAAYNGVATFIPCCF
jgi:opacity protein-like surface antigen